VTRETGSDKPASEGKLKGRWCWKHHANGSGDSATVQRRSGMDVTDRSSLPRRPLPTTVDDLPRLDAGFDGIIAAGLTAIPLTLSAKQRAAIDDHVRLLVAWNEHINLSGLRTAHEIARGHVLDALLAVPALRQLARGRDSSLLDIGSGGGFPGLPLAVSLPAKRAALVDSIAKKASFLHAAAALVGPKIEALSERVEDLADEPEHREGWDLVTARAVGTVAECAEIGLPLARRGGHVVIWKRASDDAARESLNSEIAAARRIVQAVGGAGLHVVELEAAAKVGLPGSVLVVVRKARPTPDRYPRAPGERRRGTLP
jgi:16S rRNA (guanine527-N7)-methyltransferase